MIFTFDFETEGIENRPDYPPKPVGLAYKVDDGEAQYLSFGHTCDNNSTFEEAKEVLHKYFSNPEVYCVAHNLKFDLDVAETHFNVPKKPYYLLHDTMIMLYIVNPRAKSFALKKAAVDLLGMPADEQDLVATWLYDNQKALGVKIGKPGTAKSKYPAGKYIALAPVHLVAPYAIGDVDRTYKLFNLLTSKLDDKMKEAYSNEMELLPMLLDMERYGIAVNRDRMIDDMEFYKLIAIETDIILRKELKVPYEADSVDYDSYNFLTGKEFTDAIKPFLDESKLKLTDTGRLSYAKESIENAFNDSNYIGDLTNYRAFLLKCLSTYYIPWVEMSKKDGRIYTQWHQTIDFSGYGTTTGRLSSSPNFQNMPNDKKIKKEDFFDKFGLPKPPKMKSYIVGSKDCALIDRDYSQQELRILAHYTGGKLKEFFEDQPNGDLHQYTVDIIASKGIKVTRHQAKQANFAIVYGMGTRALAAKLNIDVELAKNIMATIKSSFNIDKIEDKLKSRARAKQPFYTSGGRKYYCEDPFIDDNNNVRSFDYKMLNTLIQGSAADCTKKAVLNFYNRRRDPNWRILLTIHDEIVAEAPKETAEECLFFLNEAMLDVDFSLKMISDGGIYNNLGDSKDD